MIDVKRLFKDYRESGALQELVSIQSAIGGGVFATKSGDLVTFLKAGGKARECLDAGENDHYGRRLEAVLQSFDERFRVYQYLFKRKLTELPFEHTAHPVLNEAIVGRVQHMTNQTNPLFSFETCIAVVYERWRSQTGIADSLKRLFKNTNAVRQSLSTARTLTTLEQELETAKAFLNSRVASLVIQCRDLIDLKQLDDQEAFRTLRRLVNYTPFKADLVRLKYPSFVDFQACNSSLECHRDHLRMDDWYVRVLTLKEPPAKTFTPMIRGLLNLDAEVIVASEWKRDSAVNIRRLIRSKRRHFHNSKTSFLNYLGSQQPTPNQTLVDDGAAAIVNGLGACLEEIEVKGRSFGEFSLTIVLYGHDLAALKHSAAQCFKIFATHDAQLTEENYNQLNAWLAVLPGNSTYNLRRLWLTDTNYADLCLLFAPSSGQLRNEHLNSEYLAVLEGAGKTPYFLNLHDKDVAHTLLLGATGSGKSFLLNFLITHWQKYEPYTFVFDLGGSYESVTRQFKGAYLAVGKDERTFTINPFCLPPTPENLRFLLAFVKVLIGQSYELSSEMENDLFEQIENLYSVATDQRRLSTLANIVHRSLRGALQKWINDGPSARDFDNPEDNLTFNPFQTLDFQGMDKAADSCEPLLFYLLHRANAIVDDPTKLAVPKLFVLDEAWRFFRHPVIKAYIVAALKTWRKRNAAMILATQSGNDLIASETLPVITESCPTQIYLANPQMDAATYRNAFHLSESEVAAIAGLTPKQQFLLKQPGVSKILDLNVDAKSYWLYTNNPRDNVKRQEAFELYGFHKGLEVLASEPRRTA